MQNNHGYQPAKLHKSLDHRGPTKNHIPILVLYVLLNHLGQQHTRRRLWCAKRTHKNVCKKTEKWVSKDVAGLGGFAGRWTRFWPFLRLGTTSNRGQSPLRRCVSRKKSTKLGLGKRARAHTHTHTCKTHTVRPPDKLQTKCSITVPHFNTRYLHNLIK